MCAHLYLLTLLLCVCLHYHFVKCIFLLYLLLTMSSLHFGVANKHLVLMTTDNFRLWHRKTAMYWIHYVYCFAGFENTYTTTTDGRGSPIPRTGSPDRSPSHSPVRALSPVRTTDQSFSVADIDPEAVRTALRDYVQQFVATERERVRCYFSSPFICLHIQL